MKNDHQRSPWPWHASLEQKLIALAIITVVVLLAGSGKLYFSCLANKYFVRHEGKCSYSWPSVFLSSNSLDRAGLSVLQRSSITWKISPFSDIHQFKNCWASLMAILRVAKKPGQCQIPATIQVIHRCQRRNCWCKTSHSWSWLLVPCTKKGEEFDCINLFHCSHLGQRLYQFLNYSCRPLKILLDIECLWSNSHMASDSGIPEFRQGDLDKQLVMYFLENVKLRC